MKIAMFTNTYLPHVGGVAKSVKTLEDECRRQGHEVLVIAPEYEEAEAGRTGDVLRVSAICNFNGSDFSLRLPLPNIIHSALEEFQPDVIHSHHPFGLGDAALREAWKNQIPIVFTHHTLYERYTHYVPMDSPALKRVAIQLATEYCNLCTLVIAPSDSVRKLSLDRGVTSPIEVVPTGIDCAFFAAGNAAAFRESHGIPPEARVIGHVGRLALEKNLHFLGEAVQAQLQRDPTAAFLVVGDGEEREWLEERFVAEAAEGRFFAVGRKSGAALADAYAAMDVFAFASQSETQGMVLAEAMAAGKPVVALNGPGVREIMRDGENGLLLKGDASREDFAAALERMFDDPALLERCASGARDTAAEYEQERVAKKVIGVYQQLVEAFEHPEEDFSTWERLLAAIEIEWDLIAAKMSAAAAAMSESEATEVSLE